MTKVTRFDNLRNMLTPYEAGRFRMNLPRVDSHDLFVAFSGNALPEYSCPNTNTGVVVELTARLPYVL